MLRSRSTTDARKQQHTACTCLHVLCQLPEHLAAQPCPLHAASDQQQATHMQSTALLCSAHAPSGSGLQDALISMCTALACMWHAQLLHPPRDSSVKHKNNEQPLCRNADLCSLVEEDSVHGHVLLCQGGKSGRSDCSAACAASCAACLLRLHDRHWLGRCLHNDSEITRHPSQQGCLTRGKTVRRCIPLLMPRRLAAALPADTTPKPHAPRRNC